MRHAYPTIVMSRFKVSTQKNKIKGFKMEMKNEDRKPIVLIDELITVKRAWCKRCKKLWSPKVEYPKRCPNCKSPYWNKSKIVRAVPVQKYDWSRLNYDREEFWPWPEPRLATGFPDPVKAMRAAGALRQYARRNGLLYKWRGDIKGFYVQLRK